MATAQQLQEADKKVIDDAKLKPGNQSLRICRAYVDPAAYCTFSVKEDVIAHFEIATAPESLSESDKPYAPRKKTGTTATKTVQTVVSTGAGSISASSKSIVGKAIKIPSGGGLARKVGATTKQIKFVTIRVPASMTYSAVILWINTCFKQTTKKPGFFLTQAGVRVTINSGFTDKTKLPNKKNE